MDLKENAILGDQINNHWYYKAKFQKVFEYIRFLDLSSVLDVGSGSSFFSKEIAKFMNVNDIWCIDTNYKSDYDEVLNSTKFHYRKSINKSNSELILLMDILEHIKDDKELLKNYVNISPKGSFFLITVPAFNFMWSNHDVYLGHERRYTLSDVENLIHDVGLSLDKISYFFSFVFPLAFLTRFYDKFLFNNKRTIKSQLKVHSTLVNNLLLSLCKLEILLLKKNRLFGLSVVCLAKKIK